MTPGYSALRNSSAWIDLSARGRIRVTGDDRVRWLHAMASNDIEHLPEGGGCYTLFLNPQGRILADAIVLRFPGYLLVDVEPEARAALRSHLDRHIIADDVTLEDITGTTVEIAVEGPGAKPPVELPEAAYAHAGWNGRTIVRASATGMPGYRVIAPAAEVEDVIRGTGAAQASAEDARAVRIENGIPRFGEDFFDKHLAPEAQLPGAVHFSKGCYLGQEIVERVRSRGGVHRFLVRLAMDRELPPGARLTYQEKEVGEVTSSVLSPAAGRVLGFGYVRVAEIAAGAVLKAGQARVEITSLKPAGAALRPENSGP